MATAPKPQDDDGTTERRTRILDAAEQCFVRAGFHRTTMQDVASEAAMSPGNLYRYFPSKDSIAAGLAERDRAEVADDFARLLTAENFAESFAQLGRKHLADEPREKAILCLEIWAEATRNPVFAEIAHTFHAELIGHMTAVFAEAQVRGAIAPEVDARAMALLVTTLANGLFIRRATARDFDPEREIALLLAVIGAGFAGRIDLGGPCPAEPMPEGVR